MTSEIEQILQQVDRLLRRERWTILVSVGAVLLLTFVLNAVVTPIYESVTTLVFDAAAQPVTDQRLNEPSSEVLLTNTLEELRSFSFAAEVAGRLPGALQARVRVPDTLPPGYDRPWAIATSVQASIKPFPIPKSNIVRIIVWTSDPDLAVAIADTAAGVFCMRRVRFRNAGESDLRRFIESQLAHYKVQLDQSEQQLRDYKEQNGITTYTDDSREILRRSTEAEVLFNTAHTNLQSVRQRLTAIEAKLAEKRGGLVPAMTGDSSPWMQKLKDKLVDLQFQYMELKVQNYAPTHPKMVELQRQIEQTEQSLVQEAQKVAATAEVGDPLAQLAKYSSDAVELRIQVASLEAQEVALRRVLDEYDQSLGRLPSKEQRLAHLTRERDVNEKLYTTLMEKLEQTRIGEAERIPGIRILDVAQRPTAPIRPRKVLNLALGLVAGLLVGTALGFLRQGARPTLDSSLEVEKFTGWRVLASIPEIQLPSGSTRHPNGASGEKTLQRRASRAQISVLAPDSGASEAYRILRTNLQFSGFGHKKRTLLVTSTGPGDGKSNTLANLAVVCAGMGERTLIVDAETRKAGVDSLFGLENAPGLTDLLAAPDRGKSEDIARVIHPTGVANLDLLPSGARTANSGDTLSRSSERLRELLGTLQKDYRFVLVDAPPLLIVHETLLLASIVDGVVLVINSTHPEVGRLLEAKGLLESSAVPVIGAVLNHVDPQGIYRSNSYYRLQPEPV